MEGKLLEGGDVKMSCKSADGSDPIYYKWERVTDKGKYVGKLPALALIGKSSHILGNMCLLVSYTELKSDPCKFKMYNCNTNKMLQHIYCIYIYIYIYI